jgi:ribonuclease HI
MFALSLVTTMRKAGVERSRGSSGNKYYGVWCGLGGSSVHRSWDEALAVSNGVSGAKVRAFKRETDAVFFSRHGCTPVTPPVKRPAPQTEEPYKQTVRFSHHAPDAIPVYTDGSATSNGYEGARAGSGVFFGESHPLNCSAPLSKPPMTNQRAELKALSLALYIIRNNTPATFPAPEKLPRIDIYSDSRYAIDCATTWRRAWEASNFRDNTIRNRDLIEELHAEIDATTAGGRSVSFHWVRGHDGDYGNEAADFLATRASAMCKVANK